MRSATCQGKICTPPETLTTQLRPAFTKLACDGTVRGAGIFVERLVAHAGSASARPDFRVRRSFASSAPTTARSITLRSWPKLESSRASSSNFSVNVSAHFWAVGSALPDVLLLAVVVQEILLGEALHALAAEFPGEAVVIAAQRFVVRREPPARHHVVAAPRLRLIMSRKLGMPSTGAGSKSIASRFMRKSAATITRAKWLVAGTPVTVIVCGPTASSICRPAACGPPSG